MPFQKLLIAFTLGALTLSSVSADESDLRIDGAGMDRAPRGRIDKNRARRGF